MEKFLLEHYGLTSCKLKPVDGYISSNYLVECDQGKYVLKAYDYNQRDIEEIYGESAMVQAITHLDKDSTSHPVLNKSKELITVSDFEGKKRVYRLLSYVDGTFLAEANHSAELFTSLGNFMAKLDHALKGFRNPNIESRKLEWDLQNIHLVRPLANQIEDPHKRKLVEYFFVQWDSHVYPRLGSLRKSIIHNDANDWNILIRDGRVTGIIDFGDSVYTPLINELAITITYAIFSKEEPLKWATDVIRGYHEVYPVLKEELDILYYLVAGRLITSVCKSAQQKSLQPDNEYITVSEQPAWELLEKWATINPVRTKDLFYSAAGYSSPVSADLENVLSMRKHFMGSNLSISYDKPIYMDSAAFQYMFDKHGNTFLDAYNNIPHVGHQHPRVVNAAIKQMSRLNTNTRYVYDALHTYAEKLLSKFPQCLNRVFFVNSGSAASDLAIRLAQNYTSRKAMVVMEYGYHGNTTTGVNISHYKFSGRGGAGKQPSIIQAALPDTYRGAYRDEDAHSGKRYAQDLIEQLEASNEEVAAFIAEPIVGCGGQVPLASGYLTEVYRYIRANGGVCISDEVQTGFGRLGEFFWGYEMQDVVPDIVVLGKPIANGHPMGAVVTTNEIAEAFDNGMEFFSSFGGNPVSCEIAKSVLEVLEDENLQENARTVGSYYLDSLKSLQPEFHEIGDVRGAGLFIGVELIKNQELEPNTALAHKLKNELRNKQILVSTDGPYDSVIKSKPPLCFTKTNVDQVIEAFAGILKSR